MQQLINAIVAIEEGNLEIPLYGLMQDGQRIQKMRIGGTNPLVGSILGIPVAIQTENRADQFVMQIGSDVGCGAEAAYNEVQFSWTELMLVISVLAETHRVTVINQLL